VPADPNVRKVEGGVRHTGRLSLPLVNKDL